MPVEMIPITSSTIQAAGYDDEQRTLYVQFSNGTYEYQNVSPGTFEALMKSPSAGSYFWSRIRNNHRTRKV